MPIRFRCPHCSRLLGIAKRKAGSQTNCPQCGRALTVPENDQPEEPLDLTDLDALVNPLSLASEDAESSGLASLDDTPRPATSTATKPPPQPVSAPKPAPPRPQRKMGDEEPLLEADVDDLLGLQKPGEKFDLEEEPQRRKKPVSGMDAMSLGNETSKVVLSAQKATLLVVAVVVLLGVAFAAGFLIRSSLG